MEPIDLFSIIGLIIGFILAGAMYFLMRQRKIKAKALPRTLAIGGFVFTFIFGMGVSLVEKPLQELAHDIIEYLFLSLVIGIAAYLNGREIARKMPE